MLAHVGAYSAYATPGRVNQFTCAARQCVALAPRAQSASHMGSENRHLRGRCSAFVFRVTAAIFEQAAQHRLPAVYGFRYFAADGGLMSYGVDVPDLFRRSAAYVDRILKGAKPGELPVQAPVKFELVINLKTAKALGLDVPWFLQQRADEVIE